VTLSEQKVARFLNRAPGVRILVIGDVMLDAYISGHVTRISPEAPVPVVSVAKRRYVAGGAANVAANIRNLGCRVTLGGVTGVDEAGLRLRREMDAAQIETEPLIEDISRPTTVKTRVTAAGQQIVRFDEEERNGLSAEMSAQLEQRCFAALASSDSCVLSDYAKGIASDSFCRRLMAEAVRLGKPIVVDPKSPEIERYRGASLITPNLKETAEAAGFAILDDDSLSRAATLLLRRIAPAALLITRSERGMSLFEAQGAVRHLPAMASEVADVTGAGDTVAAVLAIGLALGFSLEESGEFANLAASVAVSHHGTWPVSAAEMLNAASRFIPAYSSEAAPR
jgi:D-beta-D-heptose 7-phosphate kinase/D-beta-D-heptose 1-phosphate adenosyltransferase